MVKYTRSMGYAAAFFRATGAAMALVLASTASHAQTGVLKFDSKGHPKSGGLALTVTYPAGWQAHEGVTPESIQRFSGEYRDFYGVLLISLRTIDKPVEEECRNISPQDAIVAFSAPETQLFVRTIRKITHESKPGFLMDLMRKMQGQDTDVHLQAMAVCTGQQIVMLMCSPTKIERISRRILSSPAILQEAQPLCSDYFNSLTLEGP